MNIDDATKKRCYWETLGSIENKTDSLISLKIREWTRIGVYNQVSFQVRDNVLVNIWHFLYDEYI